MAILRRYTPQVQPISIDEAFLDVTGSRALFGDGEQIGRLIKAAIRDEVGLTASVGVASTKLVAKIASELRKPDGLVVVPPGDGGGVPGAAADLEAVGRGRQDGARRCATSASSRSATSPRCRRTCSCGGSASTAARSSTVPWAGTGSRRRRRPGEVDQARAHLRRRHGRPREDRADAAGHGRGRRVAAAVGRPEGGHGRRSSCATPRSPRSRARYGLEVPADLTEPIYEAAVTLLRPRAPRAADPPRGRDGVELPRPRAAGAVRRRGPAPATRPPRRSTGSGASTANASITRATAGAGGRARAVRAGPDVGRGGPAGPGRRGVAARTSRGG